MHSPQLAAGIFISPITRQCIRPSPFTHQLTSLPMVVAGQGLAIGVAIVPNGGSFAGDAVDSLKPPGWPGYLPPHSGRSHQDHMLLRLAVAATSLAPRPPDGVSTKLTVEAMRELITLAENQREEACSSDRGGS